MINLEKPAEQNSELNFTNAVGYCFFPIEDPEKTRQELWPLCVKHDLRGTIILASEGLNFGISARRDDMNDFLDEFTTYFEGRDLRIKKSLSDCFPFSRMLIKVKKETIPMAIQGIDPASQPAPYISAAELKKWYDEGKDFAILDTRNDYETEVGTFEGAKLLKLRHFRKFSEAVDEQFDEPKDKPIVTFCTGGIRCEKAAPLLIQKGYKNVYQLDGGILKYFEEVGGDYWKGTCFVFDHRGAVNAELQETNPIHCYKCRNPLKSLESVCPFCGPTAERTSENTEEKYEWM